MRISLLCCALISLFGCASVVQKAPPAQVEDFPRHHRCGGYAYPFMQVQTLACSRLSIKPKQIVLDPQNYDRLWGEMERCAGRKFAPETRLHLCGILVLKAKGRELST